MTWQQLSTHINIGLAEGRIKSDDEAKVQLYGELCRLGFLITFSGQTYFELNGSDYDKIK